MKRWINVLKMKWFKFQIEYFRWQSENMKIRRLKILNKIEKIMQSVGRMQ